MRTAPHILTVVLFSAAFPIALIAQSAPPPAAPTSAAPAAAADLPDAPVNASPVLQPTGPTAVLDTSMGRITCKLFATEAPEAVANFVGLAEGSKDWTDPVTHAKMHRKPLYNGTTFHRVIPEFMVQGGDPLATGEGDPGYSFNDEFNANLNFDVAGRLAMANSGPNTNGSQFFITEAPVDELNQKYSLFGQCYDAGVAVIKAIARVPRDAQDKPLDPVTLTKVTIVRDGQPMPPAPVLPTPAPASAGPAAPAAIPAPQP
jgi:peptidyl-prolyl cis-trans isomerase A (cyclophilin A)